MANNRWLDNDPEIMKKIPPVEQKVASVEVLWIGDTPLRVILLLIGMVPGMIFMGGRMGREPIIDLGLKGRLCSLAFFFAMLALIHFLGRKEKNRVDIYPEMIVFYDYDYYQKKARLTRFYYWKDIVQYHRKKPYIWLESKEKLATRTFTPMRKLLPYFRQYAPHAREVNFNMEDYWKFRLKENRPEDKSPEELAIEAEMAANREKAKEILANAKDVTAIMEDVEKKRASDEAKKAKDFWNKYPEG